MCWKFWSHYADDGEASRLGLAGRQAGRQGFGGYIWSVVSARGDTHAARNALGIAPSQFTILVEAHKGDVGNKAARHDG